MEFGSVQTFQVSKLPIEFVTVFSQRAEVTRLIRLDLEEGLNKIVVNGFVENVVEDTVRVNAKGDGVIQEVQFRSKPLRENEYPEQLKNLKKVEKEWCEKLDQLTQQKREMERRAEALTRMAGQNPWNKEYKEGTPVNPFDATLLEKVSQFFDSYEKHMDTLNKRTFEQNRHIEEVKRKKDEVSDAVRKEMLQSAFKREVTILLCCEKPSKSLIEISYQVFAASWRPEYDIRVKTNAQGQQRLKLHYQGIITQSSGEDWTKTKLILSTTNPSQDVLRVNQLETLNVCFQSRQEMIKERPRQRFQNVNLFANKSWQTQSTTGFGQRDHVEQSIQPQSTEEEIMDDAGYVTASLDPEYERERSFAPVFNIDREATIPSDSGDHKVTITTLEVVPKIVYKCVPQINLTVFVTASARNETPFPFLAGNASIYFNNNFLSVSSIGPINRGEKFSCNLGTDPSVVITYGSLHKTTSEVGPIVKIGRVSAERKITVQNLKQKEEVLLMLQEHLPKSSDQRIQVKLISPELTTPGSKHGEIEPGAILNAKNNIEWTVVLQPGDIQELQFIYNIDHPVGETLCYYIGN